MQIKEMQLKWKKNRLNKHKMKWIIYEYEMNNEIFIILRDNF